MLDDAVWDADPLYHSCQSPAEGIDAFAPAVEEMLNFGTDAQDQHICLMLEEEAEDGTRYFEPIRFYTVVLNYAPPAGRRMLLAEEPAAEPADTVQSRYVQAGQTFALPADYVWTDAEGNEMTSLTVTEPAAFYAVALAAEMETRTTPEVAPITDGPYANFYIWLDDTRFVCIGNVDISNGAYSYDYATKSSIAALFNTTYIASNIAEEGMEVDPYNIQDGIQIRYSKSVPTDTSTSAHFSINSNRYYNYETWQAEPDKVDFGNALNGGYSYTCYATVATGLADGTTYVPISFYTATLDYSAAGGTNQVQYVQSGVTSTLSLSDAYLWTTDPEGNNPITGTELQNITAPVTLYAQPAAPKEVTVTFEGAGEIQPIVTTTGTVTLPDLANTEYSGMIWVEKDSTDGTWYAADGETTAPVTQDTTFVAVPAKYTVTFVDADGETKELEYDYGTELNFADSAPGLPPNYVWTDEDGNVYEADTVITHVTKDQTFTAVGKPIAVTYDVNFPTSYDLSLENLKQEDPVPVLVGDATVIVPAGYRTTIHDVSDQNVDLTLSRETRRHAVAHFHGWKTENGTLIDPNSRLSYAALNALDADGDGTVTLTGEWSYERIFSVNFFVRYSVGKNVSSNAIENYTDVVFTTYVGGMDTVDPNNYSVKTLNEQFAFGKTDGVAYNAAEFYEYDQQVRALYGEKESGIWLPEFPDDADMLNVLESINPNETLYAVESGTGDLVAVDRSELNTDNYEIRWYMFKSTNEGNGGDDTWHIDGLLVKKQGKITINKDFAGDEAAIQAAENGNFSITAQNGTLENGVFTPFTNDKARKHTLLLENADKTGEHSYQWFIDAVSLGEYWKIEENAQTVTVDGKEYIYYTEYSIYDSDGNITEVAEYGTKAYVVGKTYALDVDPDQGMTVEFKNFYYPKDTLLIKKEDADTGKPLGGAAFELWQYNTNGVPVQLKFSYNDATQQYEFDADNGTVTTISTGSSGYANVALSGFSYEHGTVILKEVTAPSGYDPAPWIEISEINGKVQLSNVHHSGEEQIPQSDWYKHAEVNEEGYVLVVKDHNSEYVTVNMRKQWDPVDAAKDSITVVLQANGIRATNVFPAISNAEVTIDAADGWKYSWTNLPAFANGEPVQWSVREIAIGEETLVAGKDSFANWISTVVLTSRKDTNDSGLDDEWNYLVTNTPRRTQIILTKTDESGKALSGATFELVQAEQKNSTWQPVSGAPVLSETTNEHGILTFDGLTAGAKYQLVEKQAPDGYLSELDPVILTVNGEGLIQKVEADGTYTSLDGSILRYTGAYNIRVVNQSGEPLPETGGVGTHHYMLSGLLLMSAALWMIFLRRKYIGREVPADV